MIENCIDCNKLLKTKGAKRCCSCNNRFTAKKGENHRYWKGDKAKYITKHVWVYRYLGKATKCEFCGKKGIGKEIQWANKSHEYKRELNDWISLCAKCHNNYDEKGKKIKQSWIIRREKYGSNGRRITLR